MDCNFIQPWLCRVAMRSSSCCRRYGNLILHAQTKIHKFHFQRTESANSPMDKQSNRFDGVKLSTVLCRRLRYSRLLSFGPARSPQVSNEIFVSGQKHRIHLQMPHHVFISAKALYALMTSHHNETLHESLRRINKRNQPTLMAPSRDVSATPGA